MFLRLTYRRLLHALDNHGPGGLIRQVRRRLGPRLVESSPSPNRPDQHPFDRLHNTDTGGHIAGEALNPHDLYSTAYYAISPSTLTCALELLPEPAAGFHFVDLGCGKGRALLVAARFPFERLVGVELSAELCRIGRSNIGPQSRIEIVQADARTFVFPRAALVVFLYHPFLAPMLRQVLRSLAEQRRGLSAPTYVLYANCSYAKLLVGSFDKLWEYGLPLSAEDAAADRHGITEERYTLFRLRRKT